MSEQSPKDLAAWFRSSESWAHDRERSAHRALRMAWIVAGVLGTVAVAEAIALAALAPLKTVVPYTLMVDKQTGSVQTLKPLERDIIAPDKALTRSFLAQYVMAREGFDITTLQDDYRKVALWSVGEARDRYVKGMQPANPASPLASLPRQTLVQVEVRGISSLSNDSALIRFSSTRTDPGGQPQPPQYWQAVISWRFSAEAMSAADRLVNPLGFQVTRYRRDAEIVPDVAQTAQGPASQLASPGQPLPAPTSLVGNARMAPPTTMPTSVSPIQPAGRAGPTMLGPSPAPGSVPSSPTASASPALRRQP
jgi:type IV secretion system protein VirB8